MSGPPEPGTARRIVGAGHDDLDALGLNAEICGEPFAGGLAGRR